MMRKLLQIMLVAGLLLLAAGGAYAAEGVSVSFDGAPVEFTTESGAPFIDENNRTQVPFRQTLEAFGADVVWDDKTRTATATKNGVVVRAPIGEDYIYRNGVKVTNDTKALIKDNRTYLPIRIVLEAFGADVSYEPVSRTVVVKHVAFDNFLAEQFREIVTSSSLSAHYMIKEPMNYGIERVEPSFYDIGFDAFTSNLEDCRQALAKLQGFSYNDLDANRKLTYDIFKYNLELELSYEGFYYYMDLLSPLTGVQAMTPILLAEYRFDDESDVRDYLELLSLLSPYFQSVLQAEKEKSAQGLFMADFTVNAVVEQCEQFAALKEKHYLIGTFDARVDELDISRELKTAYKNENKDKVLNEVIPAYNELAAGLKKFKGTGKNKGGSKNFQRGKEYYERLAKYLTGSDKSVSQMAALLDREIDSALDEIYELMAQDDWNVLFDAFVGFDYGSDDPLEIMKMLKAKTAEDYPAGPPVSYTVKTIHPSLEEFLSPAFYMLPPIDDYTSNVIYINNSKASGDAMFSTMAHEGFPGHLYQITYFSYKEPNPIRHAFSAQGYDEGWAEYAEFNAYGFLDYPVMGEQMEKLFRCDSELNTAILCRADIGVNYEGWSERDLKKFLSPFGMEDVSRWLYEMVIQNPANYLKYGIGYLEFKLLREYAEDKAGDAFSLKDFHQSVLDVGPAPFSILRKAL